MIGVISAIILVCQNVCAPLWTSIWDFWCLFFLSGRLQGRMIPGWQIMWHKRRQSQHESWDDGRMTIPVHTSNRAFPFCLTIDSLQTHGSIHPACTVSQLLRRHPTKETTKRQQKEIASIRSDSRLHLILWLLLCNILDYVGILKMDSGGIL